MALALERLGVELPERWRRWLDLNDSMQGWLRVEEFRQNGDLVVRAEIPGMDPDKDVEVAVDDSTLCISARREEKSEQGEREKGTYHSEFRYGQFSRTLTLPKGVAADQVTATCKNGVLEVRVPWPTDEATAPTKVKVSQS